ncbi:MAG TPA: UDP-glucose 4-epimerase GalE [Bryobacteraceae bacterium]|nr:UDP-glucose 4-epimerase GalE [Bryobacteraceae bacterium]
MPTILVTGGAGYIGSHTVHQLLQSGFRVVVADDLSKGHAASVPDGLLRVCSLFDREQLAGILRAERVDAVIHFAAFIAVGESTREPEKYFHNNTGGSISLFSAMADAGVNKLVFSSTAAVYGNPDFVPIPENAAIRAVNPYGESKLMVEKVLEWLDASRGVRSIRLRYFNACGANNAAGLGERHEPETHLIPLILRAARTGNPVTLFGDDYDTPDGTCVRDYVHVDDLASAHIAAVNHLLGGGASATFNAGTGRGFSVREVVDAVEKVTGRKVPYVMGPRREGDPAQLVADSSLLRGTLGWQPKFDTLESIIESAWVFETQNFH